MIGFVSSQRNDWEKSKVISSNLQMDMKKKEEISEVDRDIYKYITENKDECYDDILAKENRWKVFYHLSEMRTSILNWYDFKENASVLEIGAGFGALTGMLCRRVKKVVAIEKSAMRVEAIRIRCRSYSNLTVYSGILQMLEVEGLFDYVIFTGALCNNSNGKTPEEQLQYYIEMAKGYLKKTGVLLFAVENYNGAKYRCGYPRPIPGSMNENECEAMATRKQLQEIVNEVGFPNIRFYYIFPDYKLTQEIYTDEKLPEGSVKDRVLTYYVLPDKLNKSEHQLYEEEIAMGDIRNVCNSYLIECSEEILCSDANYIALSTDRGREHSFATVIKKTQVVKTALYENGKKNLKKSYENIVKLHEAGIQVVPHAYQNDKLIMPLVKSPKLVDKLPLLAIESKEKFFQAIDRIYDNIARSSNKVKKGDKIYLENGYIDMVPLNCFADAEGYYFFDQEFCEKNCPIKYIMFRALRYTYLTYPDLEQYVSLESMKKRYGLEEEWQEYLLKEDEFIWDNRQHRVNHCFYEWIANGMVQNIEQKG